MTIEAILKTHEDALEIVMSVLNADRTYIMLNKTRELSVSEESEINKIIRKRIDGAPLAYLINKRGFWRSVFYVDENVLIPQPDTEILVEKAYETLMNSDKPRLDILDLCAGSGCIGISLANELVQHGKKINLWLSDISEKAFAVFSKNADEILNKEVSVHKVTGDLFSALEGCRFDCIVTNPPYIESDIISTLPSDVQAEPHLALDGGPDGLDLVRRIANDCSGYLKNGGVVFCEIGYNQGQQACGIFNKVCKNVELFKDLGNNDRVVKACF